MTEKLFADQDLQNAARLVRDAMLSALPEPEECEDEFSDEFYARMDKLIKKYHRHQSAHKWMRRVAAVFIAAIIGITSWLTVDVRAREALFEWVRTVYENFVEYRYSGEQTQAELPEYELTWIPDGFELVNEYHDKVSGYVLYVHSKNGDVIVFKYMLPNDGSSAQFLDLEDDMHAKKVTVQGVVADYYYDGSDTNNLVWRSIDGSVIFVLNSSLEELVILNIAENVNLVKATK